MALWATKPPAAPLSRLRASDETMVMRYPALVCQADHAVAPLRPRAATTTAPNLPKQPASRPAAACPLDKPPSISEPAGVPATPRARLAQRASARVGRKSIAGAHPTTQGTGVHATRALAIDCRPIQPLPTPRSFRESF